MSLQQIFGEREGKGVVVKELGTWSAKSTNEDHGEEEEEEEEEKGVIGGVL